tara:strand:+ start:95 stop:562 length:468 start_codon:yes stop_codon:yes gene_type:complete
LSEIGDKYYSEEAETLIYATGLAESNYQYIRQHPTGPARSFRQVEPDTAMDNIVNYLEYRPHIIPRLARAAHTTKNKWETPANPRHHGKLKSWWERELEQNLASAICHVRLKYWRVPKKIPKSIEGMADYWLKSYNAGGKGSIKHFLDAWEGRRK